MRRVVEAEGRHSQERRGQTAPLMPTGARPLVVAIADAQPLPTFIFGPDGELLACSRSAGWLCASGEGETPRVLAHDGTDLWTIVAARSEEADPTFDIRVRLRTPDGQATDTTLTAIPFRGPGGSLGGAIVFVTVTPGDRRALAYEGLRTMSDEESYQALDEIVARLGMLVGADYMCMAETDPDDPEEASLLAAWEPHGNAQPSPESAATLAGTLARPLKGRRFVCVADGAAESLTGNSWLADKGFGVYIGVALPGSDGRRLGMLVGLWREPPSDIAGACATLSIMSTRAAEILARLVAERELKDSEQRYGAVFQGSSVPILLIEPVTTQIIDANPAACAFYGYNREDLVTMSVLQVDALPADTVQAELERAVDGTRVRFAGKHRTADGSARDVEVSTGSIMVGGRRLLYSMLTDVTERLRMEAQIERHQRSLEQIVSQRTQDLLRANAELQHASVARDMIFANLTQEVRTSLQTITGFSELMLGGMAGELTDEQRRQTAMVLEAGRRLSAFVNSLIESQRDDDGDLRCEPEAFDLVELVESVVFGLSSFAADKGLRIAMAADVRPIDVETDRYKVQKVLLNLLSNAIKYTERGEVSVTVGHSEEGQSTITVSDTGRGIDPERLKSLFEGPEMHEPAAGIGLPASRRIADALGATIEVASVPGRGSVFTLRLPDRCIVEPADTPGRATADDAG
ncbi:MAG: PAS domain-containing sensor histidine kinase [Coriobacteriia bacterium]|nr:PAS domain-containing sensor histidine kinase [Coriobacteriia bacterium]